MAPDRATEEAWTLMRCVCGYPLEYHDLGTRRCPGLKTGKFRQPPPVDTSDYRVIMARDAARRQEALEAARRPYVPTVVPPPLIPARAPQAACELARHQGGQALGLGRRAIEAGYRVAAFYWMAHDGTEGCAVKLQRPPMYAVATWKRKAGNAGKLTGWGADLAYVWRDGQIPVKLTHTELEGVDL